MDALQEFAIENPVQVSMLFIVVHVIMQYWQVIGVWPARVIPNEPDMYCWRIHTNVMHDLASVPKFRWMSCLKKNFCE